MNVCWRIKRNNFVVDKDLRKLKTSSKVTHDYNMSFRKALFDHTIRFNRALMIVVKYMILMQNCIDFHRRTWNRILKNQYMIQHWMNITNNKFCKGNSFLLSNGWLYWYKILFIQIMPFSIDLFFITNSNFASSTSYLLRIFLHWYMRSCICHYSL